jgi:hypothetical protein
MTHLTIAQELRLAAQAIKDQSASGLDVMSRVDINLLVAAWLESEADTADEPTPYGEAGVRFVYDHGGLHPALALARVVNGRGAQ